MFLSLLCVLFLSNFYVGVSVSASDKVAFACPLCRPPCTNCDCKCFPPPFFCLFCQTYIDVCTPFGPFCHVPGNILRLCSRDSAARILEPVFNSSTLGTLCPELGRCENDPPCAAQIELFAHLSGNATVTSLEQFCTDPNYAPNGCFFDFASGICYFKKMSQLNEPFCDNYAIVKGDPHYETFDGLKFNYDGLCSYLLTTNDCESTNEKEKEKGKNPFFEVIVQHKRCQTHTKNTFCVGRLTIRISNNKILSSGSLVDISITSNKVKVNGKYVKLPFKHSLFQLDKIIDITNVNTESIKFSASFGHVIYSSGTIKVSMNNDILTCGLLGNNNENMKDDLMFRNGTYISLKKLPDEKIITEWGDSWFVPQSDQLLRCQLYPDHSQGFLSKCKFDLNQVYSYCENMIQSHFKLLHGSNIDQCFKSSDNNHIDASTIYDDCITEICACGKKKISQCDPTFSINKFALACRQNDVILQETTWKI